MLCCAIDTLEGAIENGSDIDIDSLKLSHATLYTT